MTYQKGILEAVIWVDDHKLWKLRGFVGSSRPIKIKKQLAYEVDTTVNGLELWIEKPNIPNASSLEEDIYNSALEHFKIKRFDHVNWIK